MVGKMNKQKVKKGCKHNWHFKREYSNVELDYEYQGDLLGFVPIMITPKEGKRNFAEFICDKCGETKEIELK